MTTAKPTLAPEPATSYLAIVGAILSDLRARKHMTIEVVASVMHVAPKTLASIEAGDAPVTVEQLTKLGVLYGLARTSFILVRADTIVDLARQSGMTIVPACELKKGRADGRFAGVSPADMLALRR